MRKTKAFPPHLASLLPPWLQQEWHAEEWRYAPLSKLAEKKPEAENASPSLPATATLVYVNGALDKTLSNLGALPAGVALADDGLSLRIKAGVKSDTPLETAFIITRAVPVHTHRTITVEKDAQLFLLDHLPASHGLFTLLTHANVAAGARLSVNRLIQGKKATNLVTQESVTLQEGAGYAFNSASSSGGFFRQMVRIALQGERAEATIRAVQKANSQGCSDLLTDIKHQAPHTYSKQLLRSLGADKARAVFQGNILVAEAAQKTEAAQNHQGLLLSDDAEIDARPGLEIYADDVKCVHGATCGALDDAALFYLRSRGVPHEEATHLLLQGFVADVFDEGLENDAVRTTLLSFLETQMRAA